MDVVQARADLVLVALLVEGDEVCGREGKASARCASSRESRTPAAASLERRTEVAGPRPRSRTPRRRQRLDKSGEDVPRPAALLCSTLMQSASRRLWEVVRCQRGRGGGGEGEREVRTAHLARKRGYDALDVLEDEREVGVACGRDAESVEERKSERKRARRLEKVRATVDQGRPPPFSPHAR